MATTLDVTNPKACVLAAPLQSLTSAASGDAEDLKGRLGAIVAKTAQRIAADFQTRKGGFTRDVKLLESGYWYPNDYFFTLQTSKQTTRLAFFLKKDRKSVV